MRLRLDRLLGNSGLCTRSEARAYIRAGRVTVDGAAVRDPAAHADPDVQRLAIDGQPVLFAAAPVAMMNKPAGVLTAATDASRETVVDLLPQAWRARGLMPVGRLDIDTTGLLLFTDDGVLAHNILHPRRHMDKRYHALLDSPITDEDIKAFAAGVQLKDFLALPAVLERDTDDGRGAFVTVQEGKYHQVKRMFAARGRKALALRRLSIGPVTLDPALGPGECRALTPEEEDALRAAVMNHG